MAGISRATALIFCTTGLTPTDGFGAAANGNTATEAGSSNNVANLQSGTSGAWVAGWLAAVLGASKFPAVEDMNAINNVFSTQIAYLLERGIAEYDAATTYNIGDITRAVGTTNLYSSKTNANLGNALSSTGNWLYCGNLSQLGSAPAWCGTSGGSANAQTLTTGASLSALTAGQIFAFTAGFTNTNTVTFAIDSVTASNSYVNAAAGVITAPANTVIAGNDYLLLWNGTDLVFLGTQAPGANLQVTPSNPTGTTSSVGVMMGLGLTPAVITPSKSGNVLIVASGTAANSSGGTDTTSMQIRYGTGTAPSNGAALTGTAVGNKPVYQPATAGANSGFQCNGVITGLTPGTQYWIDLSCNITGGGTGTLQLIGLSGIEQ